MPGDRESRPDSAPTVDTQELLARIAAALPAKAGVTEVVETVRRVLDETAPGVGESGAAGLAGEPGFLFSPGFFRQVLRSLHDGVVVVREDGTIVFFNDAAERMFGYSRDEIVGRNLSLLVPAGQRSAHAEEVRRFVESGRQSYLMGERGAVRIAGCRRDQTTFPADVSIVRAGDLLVATVADVSERERAAAALRDKEARYRAVIENTVEGFWQVDAADHRTTDVNAALCNMLGFSREEMLGRSPLQFASPESREIFRQQMARISTTDHRSYEVVLRAKDGRDVHVRINATTYRDRSGEPAGAFAFITDVTERRRAEMEAERQSAYMRAVLDSMPQGISVFDENLRLMLWNQQFIDVLGLPQTLVKKGIQFADLIRVPAERGEYGPGDPEEYIRERVELALRFEPHHIERTRPDGRTLDVRGQPMYFFGGVVGFVTTYTDITERKRAEQELARKNTILQTIIDNMPGGITLFGSDLRMITCNEQLKRLLDFPEDLFKGGVPSLDSLLLFNARRGEYGPGDPEVIVAPMIERARHPVPHVFERTRPDGTVLEVRGTPLPLGGFVTMYTDITDRRRAEEAARRAEQLVGDAIGYSPTFVWEVDAEGRFTFVRGIEKVLGLTAAPLLGRRFDELRYRDDAAADGVAAIMKAMAERRPFENVAVANRHASGARVWVSTSGHPINDREGRFVGYRGVGVDITELTAAKQELERMALHDPLTGLANRRKFMERFQLECDRRRRAGRALSLLVIDLDHFKEVNDRFGHLAGDACLKHVAAVLEANVRSIDLVARFGGEEFVVLLPETGLAKAATVGEKLRAALEMARIPVESLRQPLRITGSLGVTTAPASCDVAFDELLEAADRGVYAAKRAGRNAVRVARLRKKKAKDG